MKRRLNTDSMIKPLLLTAMESFHNLGIGGISNCVLYANKQDIFFYEMCQNAKWELWICQAKVQYKQQPSSLASCISPSVVIKYR